MNDQELRFGLTGARSRTRTRATRTPAESLRETGENHELGVNLDGQSSTRSISIPSRS